MDYAKYIVSIGLLLAVAIIYEKYKVHTEEDEEMRQYQLVSQYLITDSSLAKSKMPILWIYVDYEVNARDWPSFFSRNTIDLNQHYMFLTIKTIIDKPFDNKMHGIAPELVNINQLPSLVSYNVAYFSLKQLVLELMNIESIMLLEPTKLYYLIIRCSQENPDDRVFMLI